MSQQKFKTENIITCALYVVIGVLLCIWQSSVLNILMTIIGVLLIAYGIFDIVQNHKTTEGIIETVIGVALIICGWTIAMYVLLVLGVILAIKGVKDLVELIKNKNDTVMPWITAVVMIAVGIVLCISPFAITDTLILVVGIVLIVNGVLALLK